MPIGIMQQRIATCLFGTGDIQVDAKNTDDFRGYYHGTALVLREIRDPMPISAEAAAAELSETPFDMALVFTKVESLDVVLECLNAIRSHMIERLGPVPTSPENLSR